MLKAILPNFSVSPTIETWDLRATRSTAQMVRCASRPWCSNHSTPSTKISPGWIKNWIALAPSALIKERRIISTKIKLPEHSRDSRATFCYRTTLSAEKGKFLRASNSSQRTLSSSLTRNTHSTGPPYWGLKSSMNQLMTSSKKGDANYYSCSMRLRTQASCSFRPSPRKIIKTSTKMGSEDPPTEVSLRTRTNGKWWLWAILKKCTSVQSRMSRKLLSCTIKLQF